MTQQIDRDLATYLATQGYVALRIMPDGHLAGVSRFLFTYGLCTKVDWEGYGARWCFKDPMDAVRALAEWDGQGDPPGPWIKQKCPIERSNPLTHDIRLNSDGSEWAEPKAEVDMDAVWRIKREAAE